MLLLSAQSTGEKDHIAPSVIFSASPVIRKGLPDGINVIHFCLPITPPPPPPTVNACAGSISTPLILILESCNLAGIDSTEGTAHILATLQV